MLIRALVALAIGVALLVWSLRRLRRFASIGTLLQVIGAAGMLGVAGAHLCERFRLLAGMGWGEPHSTGHYLDLVSAAVAVTLLPLGLVIEFLRRVRR